MLNENYLLSFSSHLKKKMSHPSLPSEVLHKGKKGKHGIFVRSTGWVIRGFFWLHIIIGDNLAGSLRDHLILFHIHRNISVPENIHCIWFPAFSEPLILNNFRESFLYEFQAGAQRDRTSSNCIIFWNRYNFFQIGQKSALAEQGIVRHQTLNCLFSLAI